MTQQAKPTDATKRAVQVQYGTAESADFEAMTWTFRMPEGFKVAAGDFAILPRIEYDISTSLPRSDFYALQDDNARLRAANAALTEALRGLVVMLPADAPERDGNERIPASFVAITWRELRAARAALASVEVPK
jgi:hypothetical protein